METKTPSEDRELACRALIARNWSSTVGLASTDQYIEDFEEEKDHLACLDVSTKKISIGFEVVGPLVGEKSYQMPFREWTDYYGSFFSHKGFICFTSEPEKTMIHKDDDTSWMNAVSLLGVSATHSQFIVLPSAFPYDNPLYSEIFNFCVEYNLLSYVDKAIDLIRESFPSVREIDLQLEQDPDIEEEWIVIDFEIDADIEDILEKYDYYTGIWVNSVPWPEREKIRLSYNLI